MHNFLSHFFLNSETREEFSIPHILSLKTLPSLNSIIQNVKIQHNTFVFLSKITDIFHICITFEKGSIVVCGEQEILF